MREDGRRKDKREKDTIEMIVICLGLFGLLGWSLPPKPSKYSTPPFHLKHPSKLSFFVIPLSDKFYH